MLANAVTMAQALLRERLPKARYVVDATAGNGQDTLFLASLTPPDAQVWAFDIQPRALAETGRRLEAHGLKDKVSLICAGHEQMPFYITAPLDVVMFNLGYLPRYSHAITTRTETTLAALQNSLATLTVGGLVTVVAYPGHEEGLKETEAVGNYLITLPQRLYSVGCWRMINQANNPPLLYIVEKRGGHYESVTTCAD